LDDSSSSSTFYNEAVCFLPLGWLLLLVEPTYGPSNSFLIIFASSIDLDKFDFKGDGVVAYLNGPMRAGD
jgi:hypothetical protein